MTKILVGTSSWADHSLVESGLFYILSCGDEDTGRQTALLRQKVPDR